jgi:hypothetical protein
MWVVVAVAIDGEYNLLRCLSKSQMGEPETAVNAEDENT